MRVSPLIATGRQSTDTQIPFLSGRDGTLHPDIQSSGGESMQSSDPRAATSEKFFHAPSLRYLFPLLVGGGAFGTAILIDLAFGIENRPILYSDVFTGFIAGVL